MGASSSNISPTYQGTVEYVDVSTKGYFDWNADIRTQFSGTTATTITSNSLVSNAINVYSFAAKGAYYASVKRTFLFFDVSSVTSIGTITDCTLRVLGYLNSSGGVIPVEGSAWGIDGSTSTLSNSDLSSLDFNTTYASAILSDSWNTTAWNDFTLNATAISDMNSNEYLNVVLINNTYDQANTTLPNETQEYNGIEFLDGTYPIRLYINYTTGGYGNIVNGVAAANIVSVNGVATTDIVNINGV